MLHVPLPTPAEPRRLLVSFSGGETSALMARLCKEKLLGTRYDEMVVVFSNTGEENEETLRFVDWCDRVFGLDVVWIEAVTNPQRGIGQRARVVDYATASRHGEPFEAVVAKYGIPNKVFAHCTRDLKERPITAYANSIGWKTNTYDTAIGIRRDEIDRMNPKAAERRLVYPLVSDFPRTKLDVNEFWSRQPSRLSLKGYEGNCRWCWKKSLRKHLTIVTDHPERYEFPERMEREHQLSGPCPDGTPRRFFRDNMTVQDLRDMARSRPFERADDDSRVYVSQIDMFGDGPFDLDLDLGEGCEESCEVFADA